MTKEQKKIKNETEEALRMVILKEDIERLNGKSPTVDALLAIFN